MQHLGLGQRLGLNVQGLELKVAVKTSVANGAVRGRVNIELHVLL